MQAGIARARLGRGQPSRVRLQITAQILHRIKHTLEQVTHPERRVLWAVCYTAFFGFIRLGELLLQSKSAFNPRLHLAWGDMAVDNPQATWMVRLHLKQSKTDQFGRGANVILGKTGLDLCPVAAILACVAVQGDRQGLTTKKAPLTKQTLVEEIRKLLRALELPEDNYAGHSFRIGAATSAALAGIEDSTIHLLGRWQSGAFFQYINTPHEQLAATSPRQWR